MPLKLQMQHALRVLARRVDGAMDGEARRIDVVGTIHHLVSGEVHLMLEAAISSNSMP
jgi:hypothetical protein